jgi:hypothetical protein
MLLREFLARLRTAGLLLADLAAFHARRRLGSPTHIELQERAAIPEHSWHVETRPTLYPAQFSASQPQLSPEALVALGSGRKAVVFRTREDGDFFFDRDRAELCDYREFIRSASQQSHSSERLYSRMGAPAALAPPEIQRLRRHPHVDHMTVWVGGQGNITPLHCDPWPTLLAQLSGEKEIIMMPPEAVLALDPPFLRRVLRRQVVRIAKEPGWWKPDHTHSFIRLTLRAGDVLYIPPGFLHAVRVLWFSCSASLRATAVPLDWNWALRHVRMQGRARDLGLLPRSSSGAGSRIDRESAEELQWLQDDPAAACEVRAAP